MIKYNFNCLSQVRIVVTSKNNGVLSDLSAVA